jgi:hypothetical protein
MTTVKHTISRTGVQRWRLSNHQLHRTDGPALIYPDGETRYYVAGKLSRTDGPALIKNAGQHQEWWYQGRQHRLSGPAYISDDYESWFRDHKLHCVTGAAVRFRNGIDQDQWWIQGTELKFRTWLSRAEITDRQRTYLIMKYGSQL